MTRKSINEFDLIIGQRVVARRKLMGVSQERLGDALRLTFQQIQKYEKGVNRIGAGRLVEIARALRMPVTSFFAGMDETEATLEQTMSGEAIDIAKLFDELPPETRDVMLPAIKAMLRANLRLAAA